MTEFTGERVIPGKVDNDLWAEHISRYRFAANVAAHIAANVGFPSQVLDIGCGVGYGTADLAENAAGATGIDLSEDAILYARSHYSRPNLRFTAASATALPFPNESFDLITAFEVIEHLNDWKSLLAEARRVARPGGVFIVSTPNTTYYAETRAKSGPNPYHVHEFSFGEFTEALGAVFPICTLLLQNHVDAFAFYEPASALPVDGYFEIASGSPADAHFFVAVCSLQPLPSLHNFLYVPRATNLLREREHHIDLLQGEVVAARAERDEMMRVYDEQSRQLEAQNQWALKLDGDLKQKAEDLKTTVDALDAAENTVVERTRWAQSLAANLNIAEQKLHYVQTSRWVRLGRKLGLGPKIDDDV